MSTQTIKSLTLEEKCELYMGRRNRTLAGAGLTLLEIEPLTQNQVAAFESEKHLLLHGVAGTGKTFISCYLAFDDMLKGGYNKLIIIRSAVPTRDIGFLPGNEKKKAQYMKNLIKIFVLNCFKGETLTKY